MSSRLQIVANHNIDFNNRSLQDIGSYVCDHLQRELVLPNEHFVRTEFYEKGKASVSQVDLSPLLWSYNISKSTLYGGLEESDFLQIKSTWQLDLIIEEGYMLLMPIIHKTKHYHWFHFDTQTHPFANVNSYHAYQDEWNKVIMALVTTLGGDTAYILADGAYDHNYYNASGFRDIERILSEKCGAPQTQYDGMTYDPDGDEPIPYFRIGNTYELNNL